MRKCLTFRLKILPLILVAVALGCLPETKRLEVDPKTMTTQPPPLSVETLDKKIAYLTTMLDEQELDDQDKAVASDLLATYKTIRANLQSQSSEYDEGKIIQLLFANLGRLEGEYFLRDKFEGPDYSKALSSFSEKRKKILNEYLSGDYQGVINDCVDLEATFGPDSLTPEIGLLFAVALARKGMLSEAIIISEKILHELEGKPDLIHLRANIIEWQLDLGNREKALQVYEKMMDDLDEREELLAKSKQMVMEERKTAYRKKLPSAAYAGGLRQFDTLDSTDKLLKAVDELVQKHEFGEAKLLLIKRRIRTDERPELEIIDQALKTVDLAEQRFLQEKSADIASLEN
jgi:tetratricopeptide (TPR) repeat protein